MTAATLPGLGRNRRRSGVNRRALDTFVRDLRRTGPTSASVDLAIRACRDTADRLDAADHDTDESRYTVDRCARSHREAIMWLLALTATTSATDPADALLAALRDPATT